MNNVEKGKATAGKKLETNLARALFRGSSDALVSAALAAWKKSGQAMPTALPRSATGLPSYSRADAFRIAAHVEGIREDVVDRVLARAARDGRKDERIWEMLQAARTLQEYDATGDAGGIRPITGRGGKCP